MNCPYCNEPGHTEDHQTCPQRAQDASRWSRSGREAYPAAILESHECTSCGAGFQNDCQECALCPVCEATMQQAEYGPRRLWCAMCGKWGDHTSGGCPELHPKPEHLAPFPVSKLKLRYPGGIAEEQP